MKLEACLVPCGLTFFGLVVGEKMTVSDALRHGFLDRGRKHFCNAHTGDTCSLDEAVQNGWIITKSNYSRSNNQTGLSFRGLFTLFIYSSNFEAIK